MKNFINRLASLTILVFLVSLFISACKDDPTEPKVQVTIDQKLVGTWELTKITKPIVTTPEIAGIALTAVFNQDATLKFTTITLADTTTAIDIGTWSASEGVLKITLENEEPKSSPYTINEDIVTISEYSVVFNGSDILATLEFTKQ